MVSLYGCMVVWWTCMVVRLCSVPFECHPYKRCVLVVFGFGKVGFSTGIHDTTNTTAPVLQECSFEEHVSNGWVLWEGMMWLLYGLYGQLLWQMARVLYLNTVIIDGDAYWTACIVEKRWQSAFVKASRRASAGTSSFSSLVKPTIFPLIERCLKKNAIPASRRVKKLP